MRNNSSFNKDIFNEDYFRKYRFIDKILIKFNTRALGVEFDRLLILLPVLIFLYKDRRIIENSKEYLLKNISPKNLAMKMYDRVMIKLLDYNKDKNAFLQDRHRAFEILKSNIQLYKVVDTIFDDDFIAQKKELRSMIRKQYDESFILKDDKKRILEFQEYYYK